ncbi:hypothetical protein DdX_22252 [Ditylenchus destructor]|uniref:Uncharacterized protein n=1 Tax=Ditylenchus destructor TaxID=166010 RepID=A0AAD4MDT2_9BILA|nr:hypothetical protein DdX_22252 [Ditylenchus destructor]
MPSFGKLGLATWHVIKTADLATWCQVAKLGNLALDIDRPLSVIQLCPVLQESRTHNTLAVRYHSPQAPRHTEKNRREKTPAVVWQAQHDERETLSGMSIVNRWAITFYSRG